ncbi:hypothetical protein [Salibacterium sp. K-3]
MMQNDVAKELQEEFESKLGRILTVEEKELIQWMADSRRKQDRAGMEKRLMMKAES